MTQKTNFLPYLAIISAFGAAYPLAAETIKLAIIETADLHNNMMVQR